MAKKSDSKNFLKQYEELISSIKSGNIAQFYILMGEEPFFVDMLTDAVIENSLDESERDFNLTILYGSDKGVNVDTIISTARRYPMMAQRNVVIVKQAQLLSSLSGLEDFFTAPIPTTVLLLAFTSKSADKRTKFFSAVNDAVKKRGADQIVIFESSLVDEQTAATWITNLFKERGHQIDPKAAWLTVEHTGNDMKKIMLECDKVLKAIDPGKSVTVDDIENNVGISKDYNAFELTAALSVKDAAKVFKIAYYFGESPKKYPFTLTIGSLFYFFNKLLYYSTFVRENRHLSEWEIKQATGIWGGIKEYQNGARNYSATKLMKIISLLEQYDYKSKSNAGGTASEKDLLIELLSKILNC